HHGQDWPVVFGAPGEVVPVRNTGGVDISACPPLTQGGGLPGSSGGSSGGEIDFSGLDDLTDEPSSSGGCPTHTPGARRGPPPGRGGAARGGEPGRSGRRPGGGGGGGRLRGVVGRRPGRMVQRRRLRRGVRRRGGLRLQRRGAPPRPQSGPGRAPPAPRAPPL